MLGNIKDKILSKQGASDMVVVLIIIVIFAAVAFIVFKALGKKTQDSGKSAETQLGTTMTESVKFSTTGIPD